MKDLLRVAIYNDKGTNPQRIMAFVEALGHAVTGVDRDQIITLNHHDFDVLVFPGGWYRFNDSQREKIQNIFHAGLGAIGICAGAYQVGGYLPLIPGKVLRANMRGRVYLEPQQGDHPILASVVQRCTRHNNRTWEPVGVTQLGGPLMFPEKKEWMLASYDAEAEISALSAAEIQDGRAVAIASHPELELAALPSAELPGAHDVPPTWNDVRLIFANALRWAAKRQVQPQRDSEKLTAAKIATISS